MVDSKRILRRVLEELGRRELDIVRRTVGSRTLREALTLIVNESEERADLFIPHYWAVWYHDGRGSVVPKSARYLVFFDNKNDDPRLAGGKYPVRESDVRRLTKREYEDGLRINAERRQRGSRPYMYVVESVGPAAPHPFFKELEMGAASRADLIVPETFERELLRELDADPITRSETRRADFGLGG